MTLNATPQGKGYIIRSLDNQVRFLFWEMDEFLVFVCPLFLGVLTSNWMIMPSGMILRCFLKKFKKKFPRGSVKQYLYWHLPTDRIKKMAPNCPASHLRELIL